MANRPGPNKLPFNAYITKQEKALLTAEARDTGTSLTAVFRGFLDKLADKRKGKRKAKLTRKGKKAKPARTKTRTKKAGKVKGKVARKARRAVVPGKRGPGRPKGSKNKPKEIVHYGPGGVPVHPEPAPAPVPMVLAPAQFPVPRTTSFDAIEWPVEQATEVPVVVTGGVGDLPEVYPLEPEKQEP